MTAPLPPIVDSAVVAYERTVAEIDALKSYEPKTDAERRRCAIELVRLKQAQNELAKHVIEENAAQQIAEIIGHEYTKPTFPAAPENGHAPIDQPNWAQAIVEVELRCERQIAALKEQVSELVARPTVATSMSDELIDAWARGTVPFIRQSIADAVKPLQARIDEIEGVVRSLVQSVAGRRE